ncbi:MAG: PHP domain-containing protein [Anaerolineae bacterium]|nr:PHP domain-containing protein [Anaerolineae bacterium]
MKLAANSPIDLQLHTLYSDGVWSPEQLIDYLLREGFGTAAITDHDRVDTAASLQQLALDKGFPLLPAVEMSAHWRDEPVDVLCYGFDPQNTPLRSLADNLLRRQQDNIWQTVKAIAQQGYPLQDGEVRKIVEQPAVQQPHSLVKLVKQYGYGSAGRLLLDAGLQIVTTEIGTVVDAVHQSGGVCLIAHPGRSDGYVTFDEPLLDQLRAEVPIDGFEVYYPLHSPEQTATYRAYADKHDLLTSAGSDSHTPDKPPIKYRADSSRRLLERLGIHVL